MNNITDLMCKYIFNNQNPLVCRLYCFFYFYYTVLCLWILGCIEYLLCSVRTKAKAFVNRCKSVCLQTILQRNKMYIPSGSNTVSIGNLSVAERLFLCKHITNSFFTSKKHTFVLVLEHGVWLVLTFSVINHFK